MALQKEIFTSIKVFTLLILIFSISEIGYAQERVKLSPDTSASAATPDSLRVALDTLAINKSENKNSKDFGLDDVVDCRSQDSLIFDIETQKVYMFQAAEIDYQTTNLKADYVEIDFSKSLAYARGVIDSTGKLVGSPVFREGEAEFKAKEMTYNYDTEQGIIKDVRTEEGDGFLHGDVVKKLEDNTSNMGQGWYTTCNAEHPHFALRYNKARVIPDDKVVTGLAWVEIEDVPLPIGLPFGLFPITKGATSGIIIPKYGEQEKRGFFLEDGGYYWRINDYMDLKALGTIYSRGSWAIKPTFRYKKRYKYSGSFNFSWAVNKTGQKNTSSYQKQSDFSLRWIHAQDPKARPNSSFNANVNFKSSNFNTYNPVSTNDYLSNTYQSSIAYQTKLFRKKGNLSVVAGLTQNTKSGSISINLPSVTFSMQRFYPLKRKNATGGKRWYEDISVQYNMDAKNTISSTDTLLKQYYQNHTLMDKFSNGMKHSVSVQSPIKVLKHINWTNSFKYTDRWYLRSVREEWVFDDSFGGEYDILGYAELDTLNGFVRGADYSLTSSMSTKLYGMFAFKRGPVRAFRHILTPSVSFSYSPNFANERYGYYFDYFDYDRREYVTYSIFDAGNYNSVYGTVPTREQGRINFSLGNNLEMKVNDKNDTIKGTKIIKLIDMMSLSTSYDITKDSLKWSPLSLSGRTKFFNLINITYRASYNPYAVDSMGRTINIFQYEIDKKLFRPESMSYQFSASYSIDSRKLGNMRNRRIATGSAPPERDGSQQDISEDESRDILENPEMYLDWNNPWSLRISYNLRLGKTYRYKPLWLIEETPTYIHTINLTGDVNLTYKWKVGFQTNYDLEAFELSYTQLNIYRDLHCWEMRFSWTPLGNQKGWNFTINAKSSLLQDLKLTRKKDFRDY